MLSQSHGVLKGYKVNRIINIAYLKAVAGVRFAIMEVANLLHSQCSSEDMLRSHHQPDSELLELARNVCTDSDINTTHFDIAVMNIIGPAAYLLKLLVRLYGFPYLKQVSEKYVWIIPEGLRTADLVCYITCRH